MKNGWRRLAVLALALGLATSALAQDDPSDSERALAAVDELAREVETLRGLEFKEPFARKILTPPELRELAERMMREEMPPDMLEGGTKLWARLGFFPLDTDVIGMMSDFLETGAAGLYDPKSKTLYLIDGFSPMAARPIIFHELVHALEDQYFDLAKLQKQGLASSDVSSALQSVFEGSAAHFQNVYMEMNPEVKQALMADAMKKGAEQLAALMKVPVVFTAAFGLFPYGNAPAWFATVTDGDPEKIVKLYESPPVSTEQVLHPEKFGEGGDFPHEVLLPDLADALPDGWTSVYEDTIGELFTGLLLNEFLGGPPLGKLMRVMTMSGQDMKFRGTVRRASEGWDGDRARVYRNENGEYAIVWASRWDSEEDAVEFAAAYRSGERYKRDELGYGGRLVVEGEGEKVLIVEGFDEATTAKVLAALSEGVSFVPSRRDPRDLPTAEGD